MVVIILGLAYFLREYVIQGYRIPSGSMENTIMTGDTVFSEEVSYFVRDIEPGDIVTFEDPEIAGRILIKRVIAVGGQTVDLRNGVVYVDGIAQEEPYTHDKPSLPLSRTIASISYPYKVPQETIWVMGDNRTNSQDSRFFGPINVESVTGRAFLIYWPLDHFGALQ